MRSGYKQSEAGVIPDGWDVRPLESLADKIMVGIASAATHAYRAKGVPLFRNQNIRSGHLDDSDLLFVSPDYEVVFKNKRLRGGDLLTARTGYPGTTCVVPPKYESAQSFTTLITRPRATAIDSAYLCHYINSGQGQRFFELGQIGGAQKNVNAGTLRKMPIPTPLLPEQRAIADALSDMDALLAGLDRLIAKKRDLKQAAMQQLLTARTRLPGFPGEWEVKPLGTLVNIQKGQLITAKTLTPGTVPVVAGGKQPAYFHAVANRVGRTVTISASGASAGYVAIHEGPIFASDCSTIGEADGYSLDFVYYQLLLKQALIYKAQTGGAQPHIHAKDLNPIPFSVPHVNEQVAIADILKTMDAELAALEARRHKTRALKQGMMQELLTGKTRLV
jgi:type I restriction enzyme S subunit